MPEYYHVRISPSRGQPNSDFAIFLSEMTTQRYSVWDKDKNGKIKPGDYLGFITGPVGQELVYIYLVKNELPSYMRPSHWASANPHTTNNGVTPVCDRGVITLTNIHSLPKTYEWNLIKRSTGLGNDCPSWAPRGTSRVKNKHLLPFNIINILDP
jgi:hypothetical protein